MFVSGWCTEATGITGDGDGLTQLTLQTTTHMPPTGSARGPLMLRLPQLLRPTLNGGEIPGDTVDGTTLITPGVTQDTHTMVDGGARSRL